MFNETREPIVTSLLEVDWYKFTMSRFIWKRHRGVNVRFAFKNRHAAKICLPEFIARPHLLAEIAHVRTLRLTDEEIAFLRESEHVPKGFFPEEYLQALKTMTLPEPKIRWTSKDYSIEVEGEWWVVTFWETIIMNIVNELYFRMLAHVARVSSRELWSEGTRRLMKKIAVLKTRPGLKFAPFGLRRGFMVSWSRHIERILCEELPGQVVGISNVRSAMMNHMRPSGTCAHEMLMVTAALAGTVSDQELRKAPVALTRAWFEEYGPEWSVAIPDTFGSESFLADMPEDLVRGIVAWKLDSGDPYERGERHASFFRDQWKTDPLAKRLIFCDGLDIDSMIGLHDRFEGRAGMVEGPGTNFSNDVGFPPISIVVKAAAVLSPAGVWVPTVKLSDNLEKASGPKEEIERYVRVFQYGNTFSQECRV
jgi:nicotinate phosphoribosyltransferase